MSDYEKDRFKLGKQNLAKVDGTAATEVMDSLQEIAPDVAKYIIEFAFGDIYQRPGLSFAQREIITLTSLLTQGDAEAQLKVHIRGAFNVGLSPTEIIETFIHCLPYVGFPKVINAISIAKQTF